jgi:hypothetical protein
MNHDDFQNHDACQTHDFWQNTAEPTRLTRCQIGPRELIVGDRVLLRPRQRADILDLALAGKIAIVEAIEQDFEGRVHLAVVIEDDPGRDLGLMRQVGHRFFFLPSEVEPLPLPNEARARP